MWAAAVPRGLTQAAKRGALSVWLDDPAQVGGGALLGTGVHALDLFRFVLGQEATRVYATTDASPPDRPLELTVSAILQFGNDMMASVYCSRLIADPSNDIVLFGNHERLACRNTLGTSLSGTFEVTGADGTQRTDSGAGDMYALQAEDFCRAVEEDRTPLASGEDGYRVAEITFGIYRSAGTGRAVALSPARESRR